MRLHLLLVSFITTFLALVPCPAESSSLVPLDHNFRSLTVSGTRILALDFGGQVFASDDAAASFYQLVTLAELPSDGYYELAALESTVVAVGTDALIARSGDNGNGWAQVNNNFMSGDLKGLAAHAGASAASNEWLAVGNDGTIGVILRSDDDGLTWTEAETLADVEFSAAVWTGTHWLACGLDGFWLEGVVYRSADRSVWTKVTLPDFAAPLKALAADGSGGVLAVGEQGCILRSEDHGQSFNRIGATVLTEDLFSVLSVGVDHYMIGGEGKSVFESQAGTVVALRAPAASAPPVEALLVSGDEVLVGGGFKAMERTNPFELKVERLLGGYQLTVNEGLSGKAYSLESSTTLEEWTPVTGEGKGGTGGPIQWTWPADGEQRFWRVIEF